MNKVDQLNNHFKELYDAATKEERKQIVEDIMKMIEKYHFSALNEKSKLIGRKDYIKEFNLYLENQNAYTKSGLEIIRKFLNNSIGFRQA
ncbi:MAG: hypothetical protein WD048_13795 [Chitinophagales bacterium]